LLVEALGIARLADLERRVDEDLDEAPLREDGPRHVAVLAVRRDEGGEHDGAGVDEELGHLAGAADVLLAVFGREAEVAVEAVAHVVAVEHVVEDAALDEALLHAMRHGALAGAAEPRHPDHHASVAVGTGAILAVDLADVPGEV